jgi:hypothetical protein
VGERGGWDDDPLGTWRVWGTARVAALVGGVRMCSFGIVTLSRSADFVSMRRRLGTLGRLCGAGRRKARWEGGGDGSMSKSVVVGADEEGMDEEMAVGMTGDGDWTWGFSRSISGKILDREAERVSS